LKSKIPFLNLRKIAAESREETLRAIGEVIDSASFIQGKELSTFEAEFADWVGVGNHVVGVANGTDAITIAAESLRLPENSEVIVPAMTYFATASALIQAGLKIRLVDVSPGTWLLDSSATKNSITKDTRLLAPVHLYGQMAPMSEIKAIAEANDLRILEDAAQAHGSRYRERPVGHWGDIATYSFYPGKNLGAFGDAGAILSRDKDLITLCRALGNQGGIQKYHHDYVGYNSRLDTLQAAVLRVKLKDLNRSNGVRQKIATAYQEMLSGIDGLELPVVSPHAVHTYHLFVVLVEDREKFINHMKERGVDTGIHYPQAIHQHPAFRDLPFARESFPNAERVARCGVSLPICPTLTSEEVERVAESVREFF